MHTSYVHTYVLRIHRQIHTTLISESSGPSYHAVRRNEAGKAGRERQAGEAQEADQQRTKNRPRTDTSLGRLFVARWRKQQRLENIHPHTTPHTIGHRKAAGNSLFLPFFFLLPRQLPEAQRSIASHRFSSDRCPTAHRPPENPSGDPGRLLHPRQNPTN